MTKQSNISKLVEYENICSEIAVWFVERYYCEEGEDYDDKDVTWIGGQIGGHLDLDFETWSFDEILQVLEINPTYDELKAWYYYRMDNENIRLEPYLKLKHDQ